MNTVKETFERVLEHLVCGNGMGAAAVVLRQDCGIEIERHVPVDQNIVPVGQFRYIGDRMIKVLKDFDGEPVTNGDIRVAAACWHTRPDIAESVFGTYFAFAPATHHEPESDEEYKGSIDYTSIFEEVLALLKKDEPVEAHDVLKERFDVCIQRCRRNSDDALVGTSWDEEQVGLRVTLLDEISRMGYTLIQDLRIVAHCYSIDFESAERVFGEYVAVQRIGSQPEPDAPSVDEDDETPLRRAIREECAALCEFLVAKNKAYGNSAAEPVRVFAKGVSTRDQLLVRMDDKISRLARGTEYAGDDSMLDLAGYIVLYRAIERIGGFE